MLLVDPYPYQDEAIDAMVDEGSRLVAYEMGLGKTMVGIASAEELLGRGDIEQTLVIVPAGLKYQWAQSIARFTDVETREIKVKGKTLVVPVADQCVIVDGPPKQRGAAYERILDIEPRPEYVIVSYEQVVNDWEMVREIGAEFVILDEATAIKSFGAKRSKAVKRIDPPFRLALTGTPIDNRPEELYSIMQWVDPSILGRWDLFDHAYIRRNAYGHVEGYKNLGVLHKRLSMVMSRKTVRDPDVAPYMPESVHEERWIGLDAKARALYDRIGLDLYRDLRNMRVTGGLDLATYYAGGQGGEDNSEKGRIMSKMMALQMVCDHPSLLLQSARDYEETEDRGSQYAWSLLEAGLLEDLGGSKKYDAMLDEIRDVMDFSPDNKVIIFCFFKGILKMLERDLAEYGTVLYTGDMNPAAKTAAQTAFKTGNDVRLFLASDAGRMGVDLPEANYLMNYGIVDSAGKMNQGNARHVRAGSKHERVFVVNWLTEGTSEARKFARLQHKNRVSSAIVDGGRTKDGAIDDDVASLTETLQATLPAKLIESVDEPEEEEGELVA